MLMETASEHMPVLCAGKLRAVLKLLDCSLKEVVASWETRTLQVGQAYSAGDHTRYANFEACQACSGHLLRRENGLAHVIFVSSPPPPKVRIPPTL